MSIFGYMNLLLFLNVKPDNDASLLYEEYLDFVELTGLSETARKPKVKDRESFLREKVQIEPLVDAIQEESEYLRKIGLIKNLGILPCPGSLKTLKNLLLHEHMDIRYFAGEQVAKAAARYNIIINHLNQNDKEKPWG